MRVPPAQINGYQPHASLYEPTGQENPLAPRGGSAAIGRARIKCGHETIALANVPRLGVKVERLLRRGAAQKFAGFLSKAVHPFQLPAAIDSSTKLVEAT